MPSRNVLPGDFPLRRGRRPGFKTMLVAAGLLLFLWPLWAGFYTDWLWFQQLGYGIVFTTALTTKLLLGAAVGVLSGAWLYANFRLAVRLSPESTRVRRYQEEEDAARLPDFGPLVAQLALPAATLGGVIAGLLGWGGWELWLRFRHQAAFGARDPIFGRDLAFYFFTLPLLESLAQLLFLLTVAALVGAAAIYLARTTQAMAVGRTLHVRLPDAARRHLLGLVALLFAVLAAQAWLEVPALLHATDGAGSGTVAGAGYTDLHAVRPMLYAQMAVAVVAALLALFSIGRSNWRLVWTGAALYVLTIIAGWLYPAVVQRFSVAPNELEKERPYIQLSIAATRHAFALDQVEERELTGDAQLAAADIEQNRRTVNNIRLWDQAPLLDTFAQIQEIRTYYEFHSVDNDRYQIDGQLQQVMLSPRELASESLPQRNWINEHLTFTHGFGATVGPVDKVTPEGLPVLYVKDIPPTSSLPALKIDRPEIYFGERPSDRVYVRTRAREFNYPAGDQNVFQNYEGRGGVLLGGSLRRLLFATRFADSKLLLSNDLTADSRVLFHRSLDERLSRVAPFVTFDRDPYLVIAGGRLFWIADGYTTGDRYPYAQTVSAMGGINYIRNSIKAVVDAYHGDTTLYINDAADPLIQTYARIYPGILRPLAEMPAELRAHLRYPEDIFKLQTGVYATYHMDEPQVFYNKEDQWAAAAMSGERGDTDARAMVPYYTVMKLPGETSEEFILMLPFTPKSKDNLSAWMAARADGEHYGKLVVYRFPKQKLVFGPKQVAARINQDPEVSRQLTLWNQRGSNVLWGTLMVIPIKESLLYVQPLYLRADTGRIPELRRVIVAAENRIAMEPTLEASLARIFGNAPSATTDAQPTTTTNAAPAGSDEHLAAQAKQHYDRAMEAQRAGDWARYGEEIKQLGQVIERMAKQ